MVDYKKHNKEVNYMNKRSYIKRYSVCLSSDNVSTGNIYSACTMCNGKVTVVLETNNVAKAYFALKEYLSTILRITPQNVQVQEAYIFDNTHNEVTMFAPWQVPEDMIHGTVSDSNGELYYILSKPILRKENPDVYWCKCAPSTTSKYCLHVYDMAIPKEYYKVASKRNNGVVRQ